MKKILAVVLALSLCAIPVYAEEQQVQNADVTFASNEFGYLRLARTIERCTGQETTITSMDEREDGSVTCYVETLGWAKGNWVMTKQDTIPDLTGIRNSYWFCLYDSNYHLLGYVKAIKVK